jgi:hypothetical protein
MSNPIIISDREKEIEEAVQSEWFQEQGKRWEALTADGWVIARGDHLSNEVGLSMQTVYYSHGVSIRLQKDKLTVKEIYTFLLEFCENHAKMHKDK